MKDDLIDMYEAAIKGFVEDIPNCKVHVHQDGIFEIEHEIMPNVVTTMLVMSVKNNCVSIHFGNGNGIQGSFDLNDPNSIDRIIEVCKVRWSARFKPVSKLPPLSINPFDTH